MLNKTILRLFLLLTFPTYLQAQVITGTIKSSNDSLINYSNIVLYKGDSIVNGTTSLNGKFKFKDVKSGKYSLCISHIEYIDTCIIVNLNDSSTFLNLQLKKDSKLINEITIKEKRPTYDFIDNQIVMRVNNTILAEEEFIENVISHLPGAIQTSSGIEIFGKGVPVYSINGIETTSFQEIESIQPNEIEAIEISYASSKIDASKQCIINIKTNDYKERYSARLYTKFQYNNDKINNLTKIWIKHNSNKVNQAFFYDSFWGKSSYREGASTKVIMPNDNFYSSSFDVLNKDNDKYNYLFYKINVKMDSSQKVGLIINGYFNSPKTSSNISSLINEEKNIESQMLEKGIGFDFHTSSYYNKSFTNSSKLSVLTDYYLSQTESQTLINSYTDDKMNNLINYRIIAGSFDYTIPLNIKKSKLSFGGKIFNTINKNNNTYNSPSNEIETNEVAFTSKNELTEMSVASYTSISSNLSKKITLNTGVRFENYNRSINDYTKDTNEIRKHDYYYPNFKISYKPKEYIQLLAAYSKNINRQNYEYISGQNIYINPYMYKIGNPYLYPEIFTTYSLDFILGQSINCNMSYIDRKNYTSMVINSTDSIIQISYKNYEKKDLNLGFSLTSHSDKSRLSLGININKPFLNIEYLGNSIESNKINYTFTFNGSYKFNQTLKTLFSIQYNTKKQYDLFLFDPMYTGNIIVQKYYFENKLRIALAYFYNPMEQFKMKYKKINMSHYFVKNENLFSISVMYKINFKEWTTEETSIQDELNRTQ